MHSFQELSDQFIQQFSKKHFPPNPATLYEPAEYILALGGKRIRPALCLMGNELFDEINPDTWHVATAIELFHNFTLIHDDIMDKAPLRRGMQTVHAKYGESTALLAGDVMLVMCYEYLRKINPQYLNPILTVFNKTGLQVSEGQQLDMDFEKRNEVSIQEYIEMIELKTSVLLGSSLQMGALMGDASERNIDHLYEFGKNLGIAFQVQDDYLDAFGNPEKFGKQVGGDIIANKKTFLLIHALQVSNTKQKDELNFLLENNSNDKVQRVLKIFSDCGVEEWAKELKNDYLKNALHHLEEIAVLSKRKEPLKQLADFLVQRDY